MHFLKPATTRAYSDLALIFLLINKISKVIIKEQEIYSLTQPPKLAHEGRIDQDHIKRPNTLIPTDVGLNTSARQGLDIWRVDNIRGGLQHRKQ